MEILNSVPSRKSTVCFDFEKTGDITASGGYVWRMGNGLSAGSIGLVLPFRGRFVSFGLMRLSGPDDPVTIELLKRVGGVNTPSYITPPVTPPNLLAKISSPIYEAGDAIIPRTNSGGGGGGRLFLYYESI